MGMEIKKDDELERLLGKIKSRHKSNTNILNIVILFCLIVLAAFFYVSASFSAKSRAELQATIAEIKAKSGEIVEELEETKVQINNTRREMLEIEESLTKANEKLSQQQAAALQEYAYVSRNRIEDLEIQFRDNVVKRDEFYEVVERVKGLENSASKSSATGNESGADF